MIAYAPNRCVATWSVCAARPEVLVLDLLCSDSKMPSQADVMRAVDTKMEHARFFWNRMCEIFDPPRPTQAEVARHAMNMASWQRMPNWQWRLYANLDAFLPIARSVPDVAQTLLGVDQRMPADMRRWFDGLPPDEQMRRRSFQAQFQPIFDQFRDLPLSKARNATVHRTGEAGVTVRITSWFGVLYEGSATEHVPETVTRPVPAGAALPPGVYSQPITLEPRWTDFYFDGRLLFDELRTYFQEVSVVTEAARRIALAVHGTDNLTYPPI